MRFHFARQQSHCLEIAAGHRAKALATLPACMGIFDDEDGRTGCKFADAEPWHGVSVPTVKNQYVTLALRDNHTIGEAFDELGHLNLLAER